MQTLEKDLRNILADRNRAQSSAKLEELVENIVVLKTLVDAYMNKCEEESQLCKCFRSIFRIVSIIKQQLPQTEMATGHCILQLVNIW